MSELVPRVPEDFDEFWQGAVDEAKEAPLEYHRSVRKAFDLPGFMVESIAFRGMAGAIHGWFAYPEGARRLPGFLWIPPYGRESLPPNAYGTREGFASLSFNFFGHDGFYRETYAPDRGYFAEGVEDPRTWIFRRMFQDAFIAARVLEAQIEVDEDRIGSMGMSQGGGMSIWLGARCPIVRSVCADMPFLGAVHDTLAKPIYRYPTKELTDYAATIPLGMERIRHTASYFDTLSQASRCHVPTQVSLGIRDPASRPEVVRAIYAALPGPSSLVEYEIGHDWHPEMVVNNRAWLLKQMPAGVASEP